jgi:hypothetical protein
VAAWRAVIGATSAHRSTAHLRLCQQTTDKDFVAELTAFIADFEYEAARKQEQMQGRTFRRRARPTQEDLREVIGLIDDYGSELICGLLLAFGFARDPRADDGTSRTDTASVDPTLEEGAVTAQVPQCAGGEAGGSDSRARDG